ncbi:3153_t:CDS:2, partial [Cetraspora pellucida]
MSYFLILPDASNRPLTDNELSFNRVQNFGPTPGYGPIRTPACKLMATPMSMGGMLEEDRNQTYDLPTEIQSVDNLPFFKQEDIQYFDKKRNPAHEKDGTSQITDKAQDF